MNISVIHEMGGMLETFRTRVYPDKLTFFWMDSKNNNFRTWRIKVKEEPQKGSLKIQRKILFNYIFENDTCKIQEVIDGVENSEWIEIPVNTIMSD